MANEELKEKVDFLEERKEQLRFTLWDLDKIAILEECKSFIEAIHECLPILEIAKEERSTVWTFIDIISFFEFDHRGLMNTCQPIIYSLNRFVVDHEDWPKVEAYAQEETVTTVDYEIQIDLHAMAVLARKILCQIERKPFEIDAKLRTPQTSGQCIVEEHYRNYSSAVGLTTGVHFFEAIVMIRPNSLLEENVQVGWNTRRWKEGEKIAGEGHRIDAENLLKSTYDSIDDQHSIGFKCSFPPGTVLGCLLDFTQRTFAFYVNGKKVIEEFPNNQSFSSYAYYVYAKGPLLYCNFGQVPFKYPPHPELATYPTTDLASQINRYVLYGDVTLMPLANNQVEPYFTDEKQRKVKETLEQLWAEGEITKENIEKTYEQLWNEGTFRETYNWRWLQAILEMDNIAEERIHDWPILVEMMVHLITDKMWDFGSFIVPYSKLREREDRRSTTMYRTLAILFATILQYTRPYTNYLFITSHLPSFLLAAFLTTSDPITAMFTLIGLETVKEKRRQALRSKGFTEKLQQWKGIIENTKTMNNSLALLHLVIHHFEYSLFFSSALVPATPTSLSPSNCSSQAKLSSDCRSLRSDFKWQSACSHLAVDNSLSLPFPFFYFEVTLLTSGPMRIGWATQKWQVSKLGCTEFSFGYDGHTGCIWHQDFQWRVKNTSKWAAGDVIGCLLDLTPGKEKFTFYQNGEKIETNGDIHSRVRKNVLSFKEAFVYKRNDSLKSITPFISIHQASYRAALSLGPYQQVTVNFGHTLFSFAPICLNYWNFQKYSEHLEVHGPNKQVNIGTATNAVINTGGKMITRNISMIQGVVPTNPTPEPSYSLPDATVCQVCQQKTNFRRRTLEGCTHFAFCVDCSSKEPLSCKECS